MTHHRIAASLPRVSGRNTDMAAVIAGSHRRSEDYGLRPGARPDFSRLSAADLSMLVERNRSLTSHALPAMETLYQQIANTHHMVLLTDADGVILHALGDADFLEKANRVALSPGVTWSERSKGTNAIGTAITEGAPTTIHADQHYLAANHFLTCSAAPIVDHRGDVVGVLDVSGDRHNHHQHTMALVRMSALMIENQIFTANFNEAITLHFHARPEFIGTLMEGIASFTQDGRFLAANRAAMFQLGLSYPMLHAHTFDSLFGLPVAALCAAQPACSTCFCTMAYGYAATPSCASPEACTCRPPCRTRRYISLSIRLSLSRRRKSRTIRYRRPRRRHPACAPWIPATPEWHSSSTRSARSSAAASRS
jgi:transcriptional regulator of acetoin/glycerol metabolism